jgi:hypothetical protein
MSRPMMAGAHSKVREPTDEERAWLTSPEIEQLLQKQMGDASLTTLNPVSNYLPGSRWNRLSSQVS